MKTIASARHPDESGAALAEYVTLEELYERADIVSLHVPLFPNTAGMINAESLAKMKRSAIVINTARGPLVNEADMKVALNNDVIAAYATDVVSVEPISDQNPLLTAKNCLITPHIAWASKESRQRLMDIAVDNLVQYLKGKPVNIVNR